MQKIRSTLEEHKPKTFKQLLLELNEPKTSLFVALRHLIENGEVLGQIHRGTLKETKGKLTPFYYLTDFRPITHGGGKSERTNIRATESPDGNTRVIEQRVRVKLGKGYDWRKKMIVKRDSRILTDEELEYIKKFPHQKGVVRPKTLTIIRPSAQSTGNKVDPRKGYLKKKLLEQYERERRTRV